MTETYDPGQVLATFGAIALSGFTGGSMINVRRLGEGVRAEVGTAGEAAYVESYDKRAEIDFNIMATSPTNALLKAHLQAGNLPVPFGLTSLSTGEVMAAGDAKIKRSPDKDFGDGVPVRTWTLVIAKLEEI